MKTAENGKKIPHLTLGYGVVKVCEDCVDACDDKKNNNHQRSDNYIQDGKFPTKLNSAFPSLWLEFLFCSVIFRHIESAGKGEKEGEDQNC